MLELFQIPWSPFCIVQRRILQSSQTRFRIRNVPSGDRSLIWRLTRERYYQVPLLKDGSQYIFETGEDSQVIAKYLESKLNLGLFPAAFEGVQSILWRHIESELEGIGFKLNDIYWEEMVDRSDRLFFIRHKERKFGSGCIDQWRRDQKKMVKQLTVALAPYERMLEHHSFLMGANPLFVDFDLFGILGNFLYSGHYTLPRQCSRLADWHQRMTQVQLPFQP